MVAKATILADLSKWFLYLSLIVDYVQSSYSDVNDAYHHQITQLSSLKSSFLVRKGIDPSSLMISSSSRVYHVTDYGADPTGKQDSTAAFEKAIWDAFGCGTIDDNGHHLFHGITNLGGVQLHLDGGTFKISRPLRLPDVRVGNLMIHGGSLRASDAFPGDRHLVELWSSSNSIAYEDVTIKDILIDSNYRGGGIAIINSLRTNIDNCYISQFTTNGILIQDGHETFIRNSFIGQRINVGGDPREKYFSGIGIKIMGNDNVVTDVVIFSAAIGIMVLGQANVVTGVHFYNKAKGLGGTGVYVSQPGLTQTRITNCYFDYTGVVAEDPVQLHISGSFFIGNANVVIKSLDGVICQLSIVDNMFSGDYTGAHIVELDQRNSPFKIIEQVAVERNNVRGMVLKSTVAKGLTSGHGTRWTLDFSKVLLFPNRIQHVQYTLQAASSFPKHVLRNVTLNRVTVESESPVSATLHVFIDQNMLPNN